MIWEPLVSILVISLRTQFLKKRLQSNTIDKRRITLRNLQVVTTEADQGVLTNTLNEYATFNRLQECLGSIWPSLWQIMVWAFSLWSFLGLSSYRYFWITKLSFFLVFLFLFSSLLFEFGIASSTLFCSYQVWFKLCLKLDIIQRFGEWNKIPKRSTCTWHDISLNKINHLSSISHSMNQHFLVL